MIIVIDLINQHCFFFVGVIEIAMSLIIGLTISKAISIKKKLSLAFLIVFVVAYLSLLYNFQSFNFISQILIIKNLLKASFPCKSSKK